LLSALPVTKPFVAQVCCNPGAGGALAQFLMFAVDAPWPQSPLDRRMEIMPWQVSQLALHVTR